MRLAESFSAAGVPVFVADVKGDLSALARSCPAQLLDVYGEAGAPLKVPVSAMGADLLARALELTDVQAGCLEIGFAYAGAAGLPLSTLRDLRALLRDMLIHRQSIGAEFGLISPASVGAIQRALLRLETQGAGQFFGAPGFDIAALMAPVYSVGNVASGLVSILAAEKLLHAPRLYSALLLWLLRELFQRMPEIGDLEKPRLVFVFDEAHTLFSDCPAPLLRQIEQTVRLIRSKGVGVYFASQVPADIPELIRAQLATQIRHDRRHGVGRAEFHTLTDSGMPAAPIMVRPDLPTCQLGALTGQERAPLMPAVPSAQERAPAGAGAMYSVDGKRVRPGLIISMAAGFVGCVIGAVVAWTPAPLIGAAILLVALNLVPYPE
jgi:hypothetical protein